MDGKDASFAIWVSWVNRSYASKEPARSDQIRDQMDRPSNPTPHHTTLRHAIYIPKLEEVAQPANVAQRFGTDGREEQDRAPDTRHQTPDGTRTWILSSLLCALQTARIFKARRKKKVGGHLTRTRTRPAEREQNRHGPDEDGKMEDEDEYFPSIPSRPVVLCSALLY